MSRYENARYFPGGGQCPRRAHYLEEFPWPFVWYEKYRAIQQLQRDSHLYEVVQTITFMRHRSGLQTEPWKPTDAIDAISRRDGRKLGGRKLGTRDWLAACMRSWTETPTRGSHCQRIMHVQPRHCA